MTQVQQCTGSAARDYVSGLLAEAREELTRADGKAATVLATVGVSVSVAVGTAVAAGADLGGLAGWLRMALAVIVAVQGWALYWLGYAVYPRTATGRPGRLHYFADAVEAVNPAANLRSLADTEACDPAERDLRQLREIAGILEKKYRGVRRGLLGSGIAATALVVLLVVHALC